jgi:hypothetical protein
VQILVASLAGVTVANALHVYVILEEEEKVNKNKDNEPYNFQKVTRTINAKQKFVSVRCLFFLFKCLPALSFTSLWSIFEFPERKIKEKSIQMIFFS